MPIAEARLNRRTLVAAGAGIAAATGTNLTAAAQTPVATPDASPSAITDQIALYAQFRDDLIERGRPFIASLLSGDDEAFAEMLSPELAELFAGLGASGFMTQLQTNRVILSLPHLALTVDTHFDGSATMTGFLYQGGSTPITIESSDPQGGDVPTGTWTGTLSPGAPDLAFEIAFSGAADALAATFTVPAQNITELPFDVVRFLPDQPIGDLLDEEGMPLGSTGSSYRAAYAWGDGILIFSSVPVDASTWGTLAIEATQPLPPDPAEGVTPAGEYQLPADARMLVGWGGSTEFRNYHAPSPAQRHANDILVWRDGGTCSQDTGFANEDYFIWGVPMLAPAAGTVVGVLNDLPDVLPAINPEYGASLPDGPVHPGGNHVAIEVAESEYVFLCHMQEGSITVAVGDTVQAGDEVGLIGNSGNTTEPHIHIHVQDRPDMLDPEAIGLPLAYRDILIDGAPVDEAVATQGSFIEPA